MTEEEVLHSPEFKALVRKRWSFSILMSLLILSIYFGFIFLIAFANHIVKTPVWGILPLGIPLGVAIILLSWIMTGVYARWANRWYDAEVAKLRKKLNITPL